ncbi:hydroxyacylglutathione hydrolase [Oryzibacter oryziterrae]|uniref:hydroxyacylglutathione hydrolase n=1 Tax=Oryzibacter oryziterrae TaxID=2766474 RepID=UPI001F0300CC|nr:hydroxyacylglutathione hydrolase [Oryzibacter oryziterrae]
MSAIEIVTVPCLSDNYAYLLHDTQSGATAVIDAPEAAPILAELEQRGWRLDHILITHHHADHIQGVADILARHKASVTGAAIDRHRLPPLDRALADGDCFTVGTVTGRMWETPGHTLGHVVYYFEAAGAVFTADTLFALGCGRLFEGTAAQMWQSLSRLASLPEDTRVYCGHEYTASNARFALTIEPFNAELAERAKSITLLRAEGRPTVPTTIGEEKATNPFLRAGNESMSARLGLTDATPDQVFAEIRRRKDVF